MREPRPLPPAHGILGVVVSVPSGSFPSASPRGTGHAVPSGARSSVTSRGAGGRGGLSSRRVPVGPPPRTTTPGSHRAPGTAPSFRPGGAARPSGSGSPRARFTALSAPRARRSRGARPGATLRRRRRACGGRGGRGGSATRRGRPAAQVAAGPAQASGPGRGDEAAPPGRGGESGRVGCAGALRAAGTPAPGAPSPGQAPRPLCRAPDCPPRTQAPCPPRVQPRAASAPTGWASAPRPLGHRGTGAACCLHGGRPAGRGAEGQPGLRGRCCTYGGAWGRPLEAQGPGQSPRSWQAPRTPAGSPAAWALVGRARACWLPAPDRAGRRPRGEARLPPAGPGLPGPTLAGAP